MADSISSTSLTDLVAFLAARLDEDEAAALHVQSWDAEHEKDMPEAEMRECIELASQRKRNYDQPWWAANMRYQLDRRKLPGDPARVLREVKAKRAIVQRYEHGTAGDLPEWKTGRYLIEAALAILLGVLRDLAAIYSDHPDYRAEWAPQPSSSGSGSAT